VLALRVNKILLCDLLWSKSHCLKTCKKFRPTLKGCQLDIVSRALSLGVKRLGHETDHSPPSVAEVKNAWSYT
jgi:hypothetical protein